MTDFDFPFSIMSQEEVIMKTNSDIISSLADALANVESGKDSEMLFKSYTETRKFSAYLLRKIYTS